MPCQVHWERRARNEKGGSIQGTPAGNYRRASGLRQVHENNYEEIKPETIRDRLGQRTSQRDKNIERAAIRENAADKVRKTQKNEKY